VKDFVFDMGMYTPSKGSILFAALQGAADAGLEAKVDKNMVPDLSKVPDKYKAAFEEAKSKIAG
jgi:hypothetical protein